MTSDERNDTMYSEKSFKEVGKALREEQTVNNPTERNARLRPRGLGRQAMSTRQSSGEQSTRQATASSARLQLTKGGRRNPLPILTPFYLLSHNIPVNTSVPHGTKDFSDTPLHIFGGYAIIFTVARDKRKAWC